MIGCAAESGSVTGVLGETSMRSSTFGSLEETIVVSLPQLCCVSAFWMLQPAGYWIENAWPL